MPILAHALSFLKSVGRRVVGVCVVGLCVGTCDGRAVGPGDDGMCVGNCVGDSVGGVGAGDDGAFVTTVTLVMTVLVTTTTLTTVPFGSVYCCVWLTAEVLVIFGKV